MFGIPNRIVTRSSMQESSRALSRAAIYRGGFLKTLAAGKAAAIASVSVNSLAGIACSLARSLAHGVRPRI